MPRQHTHYVHISHVQQFKACRQSWAWGAPQGRNLTPRDKYAPFFTGSLVHHCLEQRYKDGMPTLDALRMYIDRELNAEQQRDPNLLEQIDLVRGLMQHYDLWQKYDRTHLADTQFRFLANEQRFEIPLWSNSRHKITLASIFDGVVESLHDGKYYLWEIKTTRSIAERLKQLDLDAQTDAYINGAQRVLGVPLAGVVYTLIRKKVPDAPKILKDGTLSLDARQDTSAAWYLDAVKAHHSDWGKAQISMQYGAFLDGLLQSANRYFARIVVNRSQAALNDSWLQLQAAAREMINPRIPIYRNESYSCNYCLFRDPCIAKRDGRDYEDQLARNYVFNERYASEVDE